MFKSMWNRTNYSNIEGRLEAGGLKGGLKGLKGCFKGLKRGFKGFKGGFKGFKGGLGLKGG